MMLDGAEIKKEYIKNMCLTKVENVCKNKDAEKAKAMCVWLV
jgi:hypothetical protein